MHHTYHRHDHAVGFENGERVLIDHSSVLDDIEPLPLPDDQAGRDGAMKAIRWVLEASSGTAIIGRILALRYVFRMETRPMEIVGQQFGMTRANISKHVAAFSGDLGVESYKSDRARVAYARAQLKAWEKRPRRNRQYRRRSATTAAAAKESFPALEGGSR